ncbi:Retrovirus-related Pol polyprotein from transposon TNT 1-94 [Geodia barretti]|uniref:Retrovirus-related Pol polyprotein from transposon TNT 1-94 n=1 Tax=Geodia barretti TaxID=519541 RepID=A0AA35XCC8_GEOBA|nr:Retrovirus-related Pol polyprotein from transposon TNT 1-94 [Geodia barretti]
MGPEAVGEDATALVRAEFQKKSQKEFSTIVMVIRSSQLYLITSFEQPKDTWDALRNHFERDTLANKLMLKKHMEMKEGTSVEVHLKSMKELTDKLAANGAPISEEDQVVTLLGSVPHSYSTLVTGLEAHVDNVSLSYVQQAVIHEERKKSVGPGNLPVGGGKSGRQQSALVGRQGRGRRLRCYGCGGEGHFRRDCPKRRESSNPHTDKPVTEESHTHSEPDQSTGAF